MYESLNGSHLRDNLPLLYVMIPCLNEKDPLMENLMHKLMKTPLLISQVVEIFQTQFYTTIIEHQDENPQLESHADNQIFHQILAFLIRCSCSSSLYDLSIQRSFFNKL